MNVRIRIARRLYEQVRADLSRPHPFAAERVGFLFGRLGNVGTDDPLILMTTYSTLADERYIDDPFSGRPNRQPGDPRCHARGAQSW